MLGLLLTLALGVCAAEPPPRPALAVVIDDLGNRQHTDFAALAVDGIRTVAILPFSPLAASLADAAAGAGKDVIVHIPMEAERDNHLLGPGALLSSMPRDEFREALRAAVASVPYAVGINNHMGSRLTRDRTRMDWLMQELKAHEGLLYLDSRTTPRTAADAAARNAAVNYLRRDVFLDNELTSAAINRQFDELVALAIAGGTAIGIGHPHRETLRVLQKRLAALRQVDALSLSELLERRACLAHHAATGESGLSASSERVRAAARVMR